MPKKPMSKVPPTRDQKNAVLNGALPQVLGNLVQHSKMNAQQRASKVLELQLKPSTESQR
jgi:hypothetical protein